MTGSAYRERKNQEFIMNRVKELTQLDIQTYILMENGYFPNNGSLPLLIYRSVIRFDGGDPGQEVENLFHDNHWFNSWHDGIFRFHHYHSNAHEVLGIYGGIAKVQLGGEGSLTTELGKGDVVVIPAGVAHRNMGSSGDFVCVGAYPGSSDYDMNYGKEGERPETDRNIDRVSLPERDPVYGEKGPLFTYWYKSS